MIDIINIFNKKFTIFIIGIASIIIVSMYFSQGLDFKPKFNQEAINEGRELEISLNNLSFSSINNNETNAKTAFKVYNPNKGTIILENINYNILLDNIRISSGDIGQKPQGFVDTQEGIYPIIGNSTMILKDEKIISKDNRISKIWNKILDNKSKFQINGNFGYKQTSSFQGIGGEVDFQLIYP
jgi:LEA14-like dessication related protein